MYNNVEGSYYSLVGHATTHLLFISIIFRVVLRVMLFQEVVSEVQALITIRS
jgi:hypothetical protein